MLEIFGKIYKSINDILADNLIVVVILPAIFYIINRIVEKCDDKYNVKKENVYIPLYNMFEKFSEEYIIPEFKKDFTDLDFKVWDDICSCENKLFVDPALKNLMKKFLSHRNVFSKKWEDTIEAVVEQYNDMTEKIDGLRKKCLIEKGRFSSEYFSERKLLKKFTYALLLKDYEKAFSYIIPDRDWHINSRGEIEDKIADSHDIVINNEDNIIPMIKNIKIDDSVLESYNLFRKEEKQIVDYLSKRIKK